MNRFRSYVLLTLVAAVFPVSALAALTISPITWNVIGLDSNNVSVGPNNFPVGARVCSDTAVMDVDVDFIWDTTNPYIDFRPGSLSSVELDFAAPGCQDAYFEVTVQRNPLAYEASRRYHITATAGATTVSTPTPREVYVERLISQNRNSITDVQFGTSTLDLTSVPAGGGMDLVVGNTYVIRLIGGTATQGYNQFEQFINFPNTIFRILSVSTTYSAENALHITNPHPALYADACVWDNDPNSPTYRACIGGDAKAGGQTVVTDYTITIVGGGGTSQPLNTLLYDFSGSSFHYNSDYSTGARIANIINPASVTIAKSFSPDPTNAGGVSALTFTLTNPNPVAVSDVSFSDTFPVAPGAMVVAATPGATTNGCGAAAFSPVAGAGSISFSGGTIAANSTCTVKVNVTVPAAGVYTNTSNNVFIGATDTGNNATDTLTANNAPPPPAPVCGLTLANWSVPVASTNPPDLTGGVPTVKAGNVATAAVAAALPGSTQLSNTGSGDARSWQTYGYGGAGQYIEFTIDASQYSNVQFAFAMRNASPANGPTQVTVTVNSGAGFGAPVSTINSPAGTFTNYNVNLNGLTSTTGNTIVRITGTGANNDAPGASLDFDNMVFTGCATPLPPTLGKVFSPNPVAVNAGSTLTFTVTNPSSGIALSGIQFTDMLPAGVTVATASTPVCGGTLNTTAPSTISFTGGTLSAGGECNIAVPVMVTTAGPHDNVSGFVSSTEGGTNTGPTGVATASVRAIVPPAISKVFDPTPVVTGGTSTLTFIITNPNSDDPLSGVAFSDTFPVSPGAMVVASTPAASTSGCGAPTFVPAAGAGSVSFSGGTIAAGGICTVTVDVTAPAAGTYNNVSGPVSHVINAATVNGNTAAASLVATAPAPAIALRKEVSTSSSGPWVPFETVSLGTQVWYRFTLENIGTAPLSPISITDNTLDVSSCNAGFSGVTLTVPSAANEDHIATCIAGPVVINTPDAHTNTAQAHGTFGGTVYDSQNEQATVATTGLTLDKASAQSTFTAAGNVVAFTYTVTNSGFAPLAGPVAVTDDKVAPVNCNAVSSQGDLDNFLDPGEQVTCSGNYTILAADVTARSVTNMATATVDGVSSNADSVTLTLAPQLNVVKNASPASFTAGGSGSYQITVTNSGGTTTSADITIADTLPSGITLDSASGTNWSCTGTTTLSCTFTGTLAPDANTVLTLDVNVGVSATTGNNSATASGGDDSGCPAAPRCTGTVNVPIGSSADLVIAKTNGVAALSAGGTTTYTVTVTNDGPSTVTGAILSDPVASGLTKTSVTCSGTPGQCAAPPTVAQLESGTFALPALTSGQTYQILVNADVTAIGGDVTNTATVAVPAGTNDPTPGNNTASDTDPVGPVADLVIAKTNNVAALSAGGTTTYTVTVTNDGPSTVTGAILSDPAASGLTKTSVTCSGTPGQCAAPPTVAQLESGTFALPALTSGQTYQILVNADVTAISGDVTNTATVAVPAGTNDPTPGNNTASDTDPVGPVADLVIAKTNGVAALSAGGTTTYTVTVTNDGPSTVTGAILSDPAASGLTKTSVTCSGTPGQCAAPPTVAQLESGTFALPALTSGQTYQLLVNADVTAIGGDVTNTATVAVPAGTNDPTPGNNTASDTDPVGPVADLVIAKTNGVAALSAGGTTTYTVTVTNDGPSTVTGAILSDPAASGLTKTSVTCSGTPGQCAAPPTVAQLESGTFALPALTSGQTYQLLVNADVTAISGDVTNTATVAVPAGTNDPTPGNNTASDTDPVGPVADLVIAKTNGVAALSAGGTTTYTVTVTNDGPSTVTGAVLSDPVASGLTKTSVTCSGTPGQCAAPPTVAQLESGTFALPALTSGQTYQLLVNADVTAIGGDVTNTATVAVPAGTNDPTPGNNTASDTDPVGPVADLVIAKTNGVASVNAGGTTTYTVTVTNNGPSTVTGAILSDPVASGLTKTSVTCSGTPGQCGAPPTVAQLESGTFALPALTSGQTYQIVVGANVTATSGDVTNTATVTSPAGTNDPTPGNNTASDTDPVTPVADLAVAKTDGATSVNAGGTTVYTVTVTNNGPSSVTGAILSDPAAAGLAKTAVTCSPAPGQCLTPPTVAQLESGTFALPALTSGATYQIRVSADVTATSGSVTNTATVSAPAGTTDPTPGDNTAADINTVNPSANLSVRKTLVTNPPYTAGQSINYTIVVSNAGPSDATNVLVTDTPSNLTITGVSGGCTTLSCTILNFAAGASTTIHVTATITAPGAFNNTATVDGDQPDPDPSDDTDANSGSTNSADVSVLKTLTTAGPYTAGQSITYSIVVANGGPSTATDVLVTDTPSNLTITSVTGAGCTELPCTIPSLAVGPGVTLNVTATIVAAGTFNNVATADAVETDPNALDNLDDSGNDGSAAGPPTVDLGIVKSISSTTIAVGQTVDYTLVVTNNGPGTATNVTVNDPLPSNFTLVSATSTQGTCSGTATVTCSVGTMASSATVTITLRGVVNAGGTMSNTATVQANETETLVTNNTSSIVAQAVEAIPTASEWGLLLLAAGLALAGLFGARFRA